MQNYTLFSVPPNFAASILEQKAKISNAFLFVIIHFDSQKLDARS